LALVVWIFPASFGLGNAVSSKSGPLGNCSFKTHDCEVCSKGGNGQVACSSVGIACQPASWSCL
jgi:hypothetical protein